MKRRLRAIAIGASAGGARALKVIVRALPSDFRCPILIVQHLHPDSGNYLVHALQEETELSVTQASDGEQVKQGRIYVAPPNYHLMVELDHTLSFSVEERVNHARPAIDILFETAADAFGPSLVGVVLTGANNDGSHGLKVIKERGGIAVVQEPNTAEVASMPRSAMSATDVDHVLAIPELAELLAQIQDGHGTGSPLKCEGNELPTAS